MSDFFKKGNPLEPLVCICIPAYNVSGTVPKTLDSLISQTYKNITILVLDNCSTDETKKILQQYELENKITLIYNEKNIGGEANFERCLNNGRGDYKAIYHADDVYESTIIEKQVDFLNSHTECAAVLTRANFIDDNGVKVGHSKIFKTLNIKDKEFVIFDVVTLIKKLIRYGNFLITPSAMFRNEIAEDDIKTWRGNLFGTSADLDVWLRITELGGLGVLKAPLMNYRLSYKQGGYNYNKKRIEQSDFLKVMEYWIEKPAIKSGLDAKDYFYFDGLKKIDQLLCGVRAYLQNNFDMGEKLLSGVFHKSFFVYYRRKYLLLWLVSLGLKHRILRWFLLPILKKLLAKKYLG